MVDASVAVQRFAREPGSEASAALVEGSQPLVAPDIMPLEVAYALRKTARHGEVPAGDLQPAVTRLLASDITLVPTLTLLERSVRLAVEISHPVYDCVYLVLAEERGAPLASLDERLRAAARARGLRIWRL